MRRTVRFNICLAIAVGAVLCFGSLLLAGTTPEEVAKLKPMDFPRKPIELVVVYPAGGGMDVTARILAKHLEKYVGTKCIVVNKTGGGGMVGHTYLAKAASNDGYTLGVLANTILSDEILKAKGDWSYTDMEPMAFINFTPVAWVVKSDSKFGSMKLKEIVDYAKAHPNEVNTGVVKDITFEFVTRKVELAQGVEFNLIPFQGGAPGVVALLGGHIDLTNAFLGEFKSHLEAGSLKAVGVTSAMEYPYLKGVPTFNEVLGRDDIIFGAWRYVAIPKGAPPERVKFLEAAVQAALRDPELIEDYSKTGIDVGTRYLTGEEAKAELENLYNLDLKFYKEIGRIE